MRQALTFHTTDMDEAKRVADSFIAGDVYAFRATPNDELASMYFTGKIVSIGEWSHLSAPSVPILITCLNMTCLFRGGWADA